MVSIVFCRRGNEFIEFVELIEFVEFPVPHPRCFHFTTFSVRHDKEGMDSVSSTER